MLYVEELLKRAAAMPPEKCALVLDEVEPPQDDDIILGELPLELRKLWTVIEEERAAANAHLEGGPSSLSTLDDEESKAFVVQAQMYREKIKVASSCFWAEVTMTHLPTLTLSGHDHLIVVDGWRVIARKDKRPASDIGIMIIGGRPGQPSN